MKHYKKRAERRLVRNAKKKVMGLKWDEAVVILTSALAEAIWREGGERDEAIATADIMHHAICLNLNDWFDSEEEGAQPRDRAINVIPFKRRKGYPR
jgi:hypothetical protein